MYAVIFASDENPRASILTIAGKTLLFRQIQWLCAMGCDRIVVALPTGRGGRASARALSHEALPPAVVFVDGLGAAPARQVAIAGGIPANATFLAVPAGTIGDGDLCSVWLGLSERGGLVTFSTPVDGFGGRAPAYIGLVGAKGNDFATTEGPGWAVVVRNEDDAFALTLHVLGEGRKPRPDAFWPVQVHARELRPGVWLSRGVRVHPTAVLHEPVLLGQDVEVGEGAVVGPGVVVGDFSIIGARSQLSNCAIEANSMMRPGTVVDGAIAGPKLGTFGGFGSMGGFAAVRPT